MWPNNFTSAFIPQRNRVSMRRMHFHVCHSIIHNGQDSSQDMGTISMPMNGQMGKRDAVYIHHGTAFSHEKEGHLAIVLGPWDNYAEIGHTEKDK